MPAAAGIGKNAEGLQNRPSAFSLQSFLHPAVAFLQLCVKNNTQMRFGGVLWRRMVTACAMFVVKIDTYRMEDR